jgi:type I restriction enzyme R subunit
MATQTEAQLENDLIDRLVARGWGRVTLADQAAMLVNLKAQLEAHNNVTLTNGEFERVVNHLDKGSVFDRAKTLRDRYDLTREDGTRLYIEFMNTREWCRNRYQVASQIAQEGTYQNRYDVTLLINGLPLVQIELKRRGLEIKEAFNQVNRYHRHSYASGRGLFQYVQLFVISNGVDTRYYANNRKQSFKQTFTWSDVNNTAINQLADFADAFLDKCHVSKMIAKYTVLHEGDGQLMVLRPYQFYAVEAMIDRVKNAPSKNGYIWHTTGSGKTLTSFKASQILTEMPDVDKVVFVVDRADLDYQTTREFNAYSDGSVDGTHNTQRLVRQLTNETC